MSLLTLMTFISALSFLFFGTACLTSTKMKSEFTRYGLSKSRVLVGVLQLLGAFGLFLGFFYSPVVQALAALGLCILMILGFIVRLKIKDSFIQSAPSLLYAVLNAMLFAQLLEYF